jgi:hypothetical protein
LAAAANLTRVGFYPIFLEKPRIPFQAKGEVHGLPGGPGSDGLQTDEKRRQGSGGADQERLPHQGQD